jgi:DNA-binding NarL/FixJ family response regulator
MKNRTEISLYAGAPARRNWLTSVVANDGDPAAIRLVSNLAALDSPSSGQSARILIADLATPSEAALFLTQLNSSQTLLGAVALIDAPESGWVRAALITGANAVISREPNPHDLRLAIDAAEAGLLLLHPSSARELFAGSVRPVAPDEDMLEELTARERQVLRLLGDGLGNKQIAARLDISEHTAKFHISSILGKLNVTSRTEAVSQGIRRGLIPI